MTSTEVLREIQKMPLTEKRKVFLELNQQFSEAETLVSEAQETMFVESLRRSGLLTETPAHLPDDEFRANFKRVEISGEPLSETIIRERG